MLCDEAGTDELDALTRDFFDDRWVIQEPPAAERHEVVEFAGIDAEFMLVLTAQHAHEEAVVGIITTEIFEGAEVRAPDGIPSQSQPGVDQLADANHEREWEVEFAAGRQYCFAQEAAPKATLGEIKGIGKRYSHVNRPHPLVPVSEKAADLRDRTPRDVLIDLVALRSKLTPVRRPADEDAIKPQDRLEARIAAYPLHPERPLVWVEGIIGHHSHLHPCHVEDGRDVSVEILPREKGAGFREVGTVGWKSEALKHCDYAPG